MRIHFLTSVVLSLGFISSYAMADQSVDRATYMSQVPKSILVLPPINESPDTRATNSYWSTVTQPVAEAGYYVFPISVVDTMLKQNGVSNGFDAQSISLKKLKEIFGADAALYLTVKQYGSKYQLIDSVVTVEVEAKLVDLNTGALLWQDRKKERQGSSSSNNSLTGMLVSALINQVSNQMTDAGYDVSKSVSSNLFYVNQKRNTGLLYGPRSAKAVQNAN